MLHTYQIQMQLQLQTLPYLAESVTTNPQKAVFRIRIDVPLLQGREYGTLPLIKRKG